MRIVFMGTPDFSVPALKTLVDAGHEVAAVVTQPDRPKGRGKDVQMTPVKLQALEYGIPVYQPEKVKDPAFVEILKELHPEAIVVIAFGQILSKAILDIPPYGCVNIHASLLPKYRGAAPIQWAVIDGEEESGVTIMRMDEGLDTGDMISKAVVPLDAEETGGSLFDKLSQTGAKLLVETLPSLEDGTAVFEKQPEESPTAYAGMIKKSMGNLDFGRPAAELERLIRGLNPWPSAYTRLDGKTLKIWKAQVREEEQGQETLEPGTVWITEQQELLVKTGKGMLKITELQLEGKKRMETEAFLRGYKVERGKRLPF